MYKKKCVLFGIGNIGRSFVAESLHQSGYEVDFIYVMDSVIGALNSKSDEPAVVEEIATADTVICAVGPNILKFIAPVMAKGIGARKLDYPLAVIACENAIGATDTLKDFILEKLSDETKQNLDVKARFANSAIDRIVPHQDPTAGLNVKMEKFYEWCVELDRFKGMQRPEIKGVHFVDDLEPFIERMLFTVNTDYATAAGFATAAYYDKQRGKKLIHDAMMDKEIHDIVRDMLGETARLIVNSTLTFFPRDPAKFPQFIRHRVGLSYQQLPVNEGFNALRALWERVFEAKAKEPLISNVAGLMKNCREEDIIKRQIAISREVSEDQAFGPFNKFGADNFVADLNLHPFDRIVVHTVRDALRRVDLGQDRNGLAPGVGVGPVQIDTAVLPIVS